MKAKIIKESINKKNVFSFKRNIPTGKWRSFEPQHNHSIKLNKNEVGDIQEIRHIGVTRIENQGKFEIGFMINKKDPMEDGNPNCSWRWIRLKRKFENAEEAKQFILDNSEALIKQFDFKISDK